MKEPLQLSINVELKDADGKVCYSAPHTWNGLSEEAWVTLGRRLHNAVFDAGQEKVDAKKGKG